MKFAARVSRMALLALSFGVSGKAGGGPITFDSALPIDEGGFVFREQLRWLRSGDDPSGANREMEASAAISVVGYGVNAKFAVFGVLPYADKTFEADGSENNIRRDNRGLGDLTAFARYTLRQNDAPGRSFRLSGIGGFSAPTGDDNESDRFGRLPPPLQDGSGVWSPFGGLVATYQTLGYEIDGQLSYRDNRGANGFEAGNETRLDLSWQYRLSPRKLAGGIPAFFYGVLELNVLHQDSDRVDGQRDDNSGGNTVWLSPGLQYVTKRWVWEAVAQKPISQNLNGTALENDLIVTAGFRVRF